MKTDGDCTFYSGTHCLTPLIGLLISEVSNPSSVHWYIEIQEVFPHGMISQRVEYKRSSAKTMVLWSGRFVIESISEVLNTLKPFM